MLWTFSWYDLVTKTMKMISPGLAKPLSQGVTYEEVSHVKTLATKKLCTWRVCWGNPQGPENLRGAVSMTHGDFSWKIIIDPTKRFD